MESNTIRLFTVAAPPEGKEAVQGFLGELKDLFAHPKNS